MWKMMIKLTAMMIVATDEEINISNSAHYPESHATKHEMSMITKCVTMILNYIVSYFMPYMLLAFIYFPLRAIFVYSIIGTIIIFSV